MITSREIKSVRVTPWLMFIFLFFFSMGCATTVPIRTASTQVNPGDLPFKASQLSLLIQSGATAAGWNVVGTKPGEILLELTPTGNRVVVAIQYAKNQYEIVHRESTTGLKYNSQSQMIHKKYNEWVDQLDRIIQTEITRYFVAQMAELSSSPKKPTLEPIQTEQPDAGPSSTDEPVKESKTTTTQ